jgi:hypothetical protein
MRVSRLTGSIGSKLGGSFGLVVVLLLGLCAVANWGLSQTTSATHEIDHTVTPRLIAVDDLAAAAGDMHFSQTRAVLDGTGPRCARSTRPSPRPTRSTRACSGSSLPATRPRPRR